MIFECPYCKMPFLGDDDPPIKFLADSAGVGREHVMLQAGHRLHTCRLEAPPDGFAPTEPLEFGDRLRSLLDLLQRAPTLTATGQLIADRLAPLLGAQYSNLAIIEGSELRIIHHPNLTRAVAQKYERVPLDRATPIGTAAVTCQPVFLRSLASYEPSFAHMIDDTRAAGLKATLSFPLSASPPSDVIGLGWNEPKDGDTESVLRLLANIARSCWYALQHSETRQRSARAEATALARRDQAQTAAERNKQLPSDSRDA